MEAWGDPLGNLARRWSITAGAVPDWSPPCDLVYGDLPWPDGYKTFAHRAGFLAPPFEVFMGAVLSLTNDARQRWDATVIWTLGAKALYRLQAFNAIDFLVIPCRLNGDLISMAIAGTPRIALVGGEDTAKLLARLAGAYDRVFDPCAGYGRAGRIFAQAGKRFTLTDINPRCIGRIALDAPGWTR